MKKLIHRMLAATLLWLAFAGSSYAGDIYFYVQHNTGTSVEAYAVAEPDFDNPYYESSATMTDTSVCTGIYMVAWNMGGYGDFRARYVDSTKPVGTYNVGYFSSQGGYCYIVIY